VPILGHIAAQGGKTPGSPTITSVTVGDGSVSVAFSEPAYKGKGNVSYTVTSSPGGFTGTGSSSPITVSGLTNGTSYTFTITTTGASGVGSAASAASNSVAPVAPGYTLYQTFNTSGTFTMPNTATQVAFFIVAGGSAGGVGGSSPRNVRFERHNGGGAGGGCGAAGVLMGGKDIPLTPGANYSVVIGSGAAGGTIYTPYAGGHGGNSSFGNFVSVDGGYGGGSTWAQGGGAAGNGGGGNTPGFIWNLANVYEYKTASGAAGGTSAQAGFSSTAETGSLALGGNLGTVNYTISGGGGGGSGGHYGNAAVYGPFNGGNAGAGGGAGGRGGNNPPSLNGNSGDGLAGSSATSPGCGGGGSGGPGSPANFNAGNTGGSAQAGSSTAGQLVIYVK
jgi:hypothetical protein